MKKITSRILTITMAFGVCFCLSGCANEPQEKWDALCKIYTQFSGDRISECKRRGQLVYLVDVNGYDTNSYVFDKKGNKIGTCNWFSSDTTCFPLEEQKVIFCVRDNVWGFPAVDEYNLSYGNCH